MIKGSCMEEGAADDLCEAILAFHSFVLTFPLNWGETLCVSRLSTIGSHRASSDASDAVWPWDFSAAARLISPFVIQAQRVYQLFTIIDPPGHFQSHSDSHKNKAKQIVLDFSQTNTEYVEKKVFLNLSAFGDVKLKFLFPLCYKSTTTSW